MKIKLGKRKEIKTNFGNLNLVIGVDSGWIRQWNRHGIRNGFWMDLALESTWNQLLELHGGEFVVEIEFERKFN